MRILASALIALLLSCAPNPVFSTCPVLPAVDAVRAVERSAGEQDFTPISAISVEAFTAFCRRKPTALICSGGPGVALSSDEVVAIDAVLRKEFEYRDDLTRTGEADVWDDNTVCGDCEDYALTLASRLHRAGQGGANLILMLWSPSPGSAHATLLVETTDKGWYEVGVGDGTPAPYYAALGVRFAGIRLDGERKIATMPGYRLSDDKTAVERVETR